MKKWVFMAGMLMLDLVFWSGCAYHYCMGMHGPSIRLHPEVHQGFKENGECLSCHHLDPDPRGPPTTHPGFVGCLKCHNDEV
jgi:hypothetical protein